MGLVKIKIIEKNSSEEYYIFIEDLSDLNLKENYYEEYAGDYIYILGEEKEIIFSTTESFDIINIPIFVSPRLDLLEVSEAEEICNYNDQCEKELGETWQNCKDCNNTGWVILIIFFVIIGGIIIYLILHEWYKRKYETHLFRDRNNLYNIVNYIDRLKKEGVENSKIKRNLKKSGWESEQITYAMKRYEGKNTGMPNPLKNLGKFKGYKGK
jgi:hypothetical protein